MRWPNADLFSVLGVSKNLCVVSTLSLMMTVIPWKTKMNQGEGYVNTGGSIFQARVEGPRHHQFENLVQYVQKVPDDIRRVIDWTEFDELIAMKKDSAPRPDGIPHGAHRCAGGLGSQFRFNAYKYLLEGGTVPEHFAESRTVFIPKTSGIDDDGRIIRSPDALRPLTLCNCDCKLLTTAICRGLHWYTMRCIHPSQRCFSSRQMTDNIFEIETTVLAHVACTPQESGILLTDLLLHIQASITPGFFLCSRKQNCLSLSAASFEVLTTTAPRVWNSQEQLVDNFLWPEV